MKKFLKPDILVVAVLWVALLPFQDQIALSLGHPLRFMATELSVGAMQLIGSGVTNEGTTIHMNGTDVAITDACSGIEELLAMMLIGWVLARVRQRNIGWSAFAWAFVVPSVVLANSFRLISLMSLHGFLGDAVLTGGWHVGLGYAQVVLALVFMWGFGELVRRLS